MKTAFTFALETGLRREEFMCLKYSDLIENDKGEIVCLQVENYKVNRISHNEEDNIKEYKYVPLSINLMELIYSLGFEEKRGSDKFIIAENEKANRKTLYEFISKSFSHFWSKTGIELDLKLKNLRKTYLTAVAKHFGDKANIISNHSGLEVMKKHYINNLEIVSNSKGFKVFDQ
jgi:integrase